MQTRTRAPHTPHQAQPREQATGAITCRPWPQPRRSSRGGGPCSGCIHHAESRRAAAAAGPPEAAAVVPPEAPATGALLLSRCEMWSICSTCERHTGHLLLCLRSSYTAHGAHHVSLHDIQVTYCQDAEPGGRCGTTSHERVTWCMQQLTSRRHAIACIIVLVTCMAVITCHGE